jgi:hypothetical protein
VAFTGAVQLRFTCELEAACAVKLVGGSGTAVCAKICSKGAASVATSRIKTIPVVFIEEKIDFSVYIVQVGFLLRP